MQIDPSSSVQDAYVSHFGVQLLRESRGLRRLIAFSGVGKSLRFLILFVQVVWSDLKPYKTEPSLKLLGLRLILHICFPSRIRLEDSYLENEEPTFRPDFSK